MSLWRSSLPQSINGNSSVHFTFVNVLTCRQQEACTTFEEMSKTAQAELKMQKERRVGHFQKSLVELAELEVKHAKAHAQMLRQAINAIKSDD